MIDGKRLSTSPSQHIRNLFAETKDGTLNITYYPELEEPYKLAYNVNWTAEDAEKLVCEYEELTTSLEEIGKVHNELDNKEARERLLTKEALAVWETYIKPFEPFEVDLDIIGELYYRCEYDQLSDEEYELLERHHDWFEDNSLLRLPRLRRSPKYVMNRAQRYEKLASLNAPAMILEEEGRCLAEEMILYYYGLGD